IMYVEWDKTGQYIASVDDKNEIVMYDIIAGKVFFRTKFTGYGLVNGLQFTDDGKLLAGNSHLTICFDPKTLQTTKSDVSVSPKSMARNIKLRNSSVRRVGSGTLFNRNAYVKFTYAAESSDGRHFVAGDENGGLYFCDKSLMLKEYKQVHNMHINDISFSKEGNLVAVASADRSVSVWRLDNYKMEKRFVPRSFNISAIASCKENNCFAFGDELGYAYKITFAQDKLIVDAVDAHDGKINDLQFSANSNVIVTAGSDNSVAVVDFENKVVLEKLKAQNSVGKISKVFDVKSIQNQALKGNDSKNDTYDDNVYSVAVSPDGKYIAYSSGRWGLNDPSLKYANISNLNILEEKSKRVVKKGSIPGMTVANNIHIYNQICFDEANDFYGIENVNNKVYKNTHNSIKGFLAGTESSYNKISEAATLCNKLIINKKVDPETKSGGTGSFENLFGSMMAATDENSYLIKTDPVSGDVFKCVGYSITRTDKSGNSTRYTGQYGYISDFIIMKKDSKKFLISSAKDASLNIYDLESGKKLLCIYVVDGGKLIYVTPENYYMATGDAITGLGYNHNGKIYPAEQFDLKYNRPDLVLKSLEVFDNEIIDMYRSAYKKRIQKLGFNEKMFNGEMELPEIKIANLYEIPFTTTRSSLYVKVKMKDANDYLNRLNVYVNDIPVYGTNGMDLTDRYAKETFVNIDIPLSSGRNIIQFSCTNEKGMESLKEEIETYYDNPVKKKPTLHLISLAVADYAQEEYNLRFTIKDGRGFVKLFTENTKNFDHVVVDSLYNKDCTKANVLALKEKLMKTSVDDYVYVHIAGHGLLDDDLNWYFATQDIDFSDPATNGLKYEEIESILDGIPARNKLLLMDACHSGEVDKTDGVDIDEKADSDETRGVTTVSKRKKTKNSLGNSFELMRLLFSDLKKGTGTIVISAASGGGYALENEALDHGIFTYNLIEAFKKNKADVNKDKVVSVSELRTFIFDGVKTMSDGKQQPTSRQENLLNDFNVK
ncbi:MAG: caspase family protein, partial [Bacteroidales bacterium]|nr:caspase family protein [Bacteroidales bacterium]